MVNYYKLSSGYVSKPQERKNLHLGVKGAWHKKQKNVREKIEMVEELIREDYLVKDSCKALRVFAYPY